MFYSIMTIIAMCIIHVILDNFMSNHSVIYYVCGLMMMQCMAAEGVLGVKIFNPSFENPKNFRGHAPDPPSLACLCMLLLCTSTAIQCQIMSDQL